MRHVLARLLTVRFVAALALVVVTGALAGAALAAGGRAADDVDLTLYFGGNGSGSVSISPPGLTCQENCRATVPDGSTVTLTATPAAGSAVGGWSNDACREQGSALEYTGATCTVVVDGGASVTAYFTKETLNVYFGGNGGGTVTSSPPGIDCKENCHADYATGTKVTLTAKPDAGSAIGGWSNDACQEQGSKQEYVGPTCTIVMEEGESVTASFTHETLNVYFGGDGSGTVTSSPAGIDCKQNCHADYATGTKVTLTAKPDSGSLVADWSNDACDEQGSKNEYSGPTCTLVMESGESVTATFDQIPTIGSSTPPPPPVAGKAVDLASSKGTILVKVPGSSGYARLQGGVQVPVGSTVDATKGTMKLTSSGGKSTFSKGAFVVREPVVGGKRLTSLALTGGDFDVCSAKKAKAAKRRPAGVEAAPKRKKKPARAKSPKASTKVVRKLFGSGKGSFRTSGRYASATVRGTIWEVDDRCDGTWIRVRRGTVEVRDTKRRKTVLVKAGRSYLVEK